MATDCTTCRERTVRGVTSVSAKCAINYHFFFILQGMMTLSSRPISSYPSHQLGVRSARSQEIREKGPFYEACTQALVRPARTGYCRICSNAGGNPGHCCWDCSVNRVQRKQRVLFSRQFHPVTNNSIGDKAAGIASWQRL